MEKPNDAAQAHRDSREEVTMYHALYDRVHRLSALAVGRRFAAQPLNDPRMLFLRDLEDGRTLARVELNALARLLTDHLGVDPQVWLGYLNEELEAEVARLERETGVTGYDERGNPLVGEVKRP